jgi:hypothetical protein
MSGPYDQYNQGYQQGYPPQGQYPQQGGYQGGYQQQQGGYQQQQGYRHSNKARATMTSNREANKRVTNSSMAPLHTADSSTANKQRPTTRDSKGKKDVLHDVVHYANNLVATANNRNILPKARATPAKHHRTSSRSKVLTQQTSTPRVSNSTPTTPMRRPRVTVVSWAP